jgi:hypothetical protein
MPCATVDLTAVRCNANAFNSPTVRRKILRQFLCATLLELVPGTECTEAALLIASESLLCQGSPAKLQMTQLQVICDTLDIDCSAQDCLTPMQEEAIISYLICQILDAIT